MVYIHMETDTKKNFFLMHENILPLTSDFSIVCVVEVGGNGTDQILTN